MEALQVTSVLSLIIVATILIRYTREVTPAEELDEGIEMTAEGEAADALTTNIQERLATPSLSQAESQTGSGVRVAPRDDVMSYLAIRPRYRHALLVVVLLMTIGLVLLSFSLA